MTDENLDNFVEDSRQFSEDFALKKAQLGILAQEFLVSPLGTRLIANAEAEIEEAYKQLSVVEPTDVVEIRRLQFDIAVARSIPQALNRFINEGVVAEDQIRREDDFAEN